MKRTLLAISLSLIILFLFVCTVGKGNYIGIGRCNSIMVDSSNNPSIAYYNDDTNSVMYATRIEGVWNIELVNTEKIGPPAEYARYAPCDLFRLKTDSDNIPFLLYSTSLENTYRFARRITGQWEVYTIPVSEGEKAVEFDKENVWLFNFNSGSVRRFNVATEQTIELPSLPYIVATPYTSPAFAIDKYYNRVHVIYKNNKGSLVYAFFETDNWNAPEEIYGAGSVRPVALRVDTSGGVHILFEVNNAKNLYGFRDGTGWHLEEIPWYLSEIGEFRLDIFNAPVMLFLYYPTGCYSPSECNTDYILIEKYNEMWRTIELPFKEDLPPYFYFSFTIDNENNIHLSYAEVTWTESISRCGSIHTNNYYFDLKYAFFNKNNWTIETIYEE